MKIYPAYQKHHWTPEEIENADDIADMSADTDPDIDAMIDRMEEVNHALPNERAALVIPDTLHYGVLRQVPDESQIEVILPQPPGRATLMEISRILKPGGICRLRSGEVIDVPPLVPHIVPRLRRKRSNKKAPTVQEVVEYRLAR